MYISKDTKHTLEKILGKSVGEVSTMDFAEEVCYVESKTKKQLSFSKKRDSRMTGRGNSLIIRRRIATMNDIDRRIEGIK